jgi:hypothetical protein
MPFAYLKDPLFLTCFAVYWVHRGAAACDWSTPLLRGYLNDVICAPFWVPILVWAIKKARLRRHDDPPNAVEIVIPVLIWTVLFEVVLPAQQTWNIPTVADPYDVLAYWLGALLAVFFWRWYYPTPPTRSDTPASRAP